MSFTDEVRGELVQRWAETHWPSDYGLAGLIRASGRFGADGLAVATATGSVARWAFAAIKECCDARPEVRSTRDRGFRRQRRYSLTLSDPSALSMLRSRLTAAEDFANVTFWRGLFLGSGWLSGPGQGYHLEFALASVADQASLCAALRRHHLNPHSGQRGRTLWVALRDAPQVLRMLEYLGAPGAYLRVAEQQVRREVRGKVNRQVNCETANLAKQVQTGLTQVEHLRWLSNVEGLEMLPQPLQEIASCRLAHPEASLAEIGELCGLSKSGANHRLRRLQKIVIQKRLGGRMGEMGGGFAVQDKRMVDREDL